ncbi:MAG: hypothetical protein E7371_03355 [Clostridiales bacterium]|nr:hypothetical protein [Clostridiales bacterium]
MTIRFLYKTLFLQRLRKIFQQFCLVFFALTVCLFAGCKSAMDYAPYVSELRSNIFIAEAEGLTLRIYAVEKEIPYQADGIPRECTARLEAYLHAPEGNKQCQIAFTFQEEHFHGEMSFDNVKAEYFYSCTLDVSTATELPCRIEYGEQTIEMTARSVRGENTLYSKDILSVLKSEEHELFTAMTDKYGFSGEIYIRLIYEDSPYYYVGIIERNGMVHAFLINAQTGKILAKRTM